MKDCEVFVRQIGLLKKKFSEQFTKDFEDSGITPSEGLMLKVVYVYDGITVGAIGDKMGYNKSLVTKNMKALTEMGLVTTERIDGRTVSVKITDKGKDIIMQADLKGDDFFKYVFSDCTPEEKAQFMVILCKLKYE